MQVYNCDFILYTYSIHIADSSAVIDDVAKQITHRMF